MEQYLADPKRKPCQHSGEGSMKNIFEILQQKEAQMIRVRCELECLRLILPLLAESSDEIADVPTQPEVEKWFAGEKPFP